ncbi:uncharacterized protein LOC128219576 [Mya arenaria]|uniref:uncharacterized protein LOC128219576 n=1 Tax=Mya arenaria TaxID=6604 RepID=UPI0022E016FC|nr:uncharacterized protein LOC128219576 [Mya arenaria]XP_052783362.1 uncharacterized protein LOC128219576 [Mya arenaria]
MGCFLSLFDRKTTHVHRATSFTTAHSNGIARVPRLDLSTVSENRTRKRRRHKAGGQDDIDGDLVMRLRPPPPPPRSTTPRSPTPERTFLSPRPLPTCPPTPLGERPSLVVQYVEDLEPVMQEVPDEIPVCTAASTNHSNTVSISNVSVYGNSTRDLTQPYGLKKTWSSRNDDLLIEELDTEVEDHSRLSKTRHTFGKEERINPIATDILLPRIKGDAPVSKITVENQKLFENQAKSKDFTGNENIPAEHLGEPENKLMSTMTPKTVLQGSTPGIPNVRSLANGRSGSKRLPINDNDVSNAYLNVYKEEIIKPQSDLTAMNSTIQDRIGEQTADEHSKIASVMLTNKTETKSVPSGTLYESELKRSRESRKRKRGPKRSKPDYTPRPQEVSKIRHTGHSIELNGKSRIRRDSAKTGSTLTLDGKMSLGSNDSLYSFDIEKFNKENDQANQTYSYVRTGTTPINFKGLTDDDKANIIDIEDDDFNDSGDDSWLESKPSEEKFDAFYGMKPYTVLGSTNLNDSDRRRSDSPASGPSTNALSTKQKLLYSRFNRRPYSETVLPSNNRPPLPPGKDIKIRPASETQRKTQTFSRYFASDFDVR